MATWREYQGRRLGPYFRVAYREGDRQRSIGLGTSEVLAERVRRLLDELHAPRRERRQRHQLMAQVRASLREAKRELDRQATARGIRVQGWEFRGACRALRRYRW